jgi:hypothetical protein
MDDWDLTERMITVAEFASMLRVTKDDVLEWMIAGHVPYVDGPEGEPQVRIAEEHAVDGPTSSGFTTYSMSRDPAFRAELARRRRDHQLASLDWGDVDVEALADALATRLGAVVPPPVRVVADRATVFFATPTAMESGSTSPSTRRSPMAAPVPTACAAPPPPRWSARRTNSPWRPLSHGRCAAVASCRPPTPTSRRVETRSAFSTAARQARSSSSRHSGSWTSSPTPARDQP